MLLISDIHGAFDAMASLRASGEPVLILGDLLNLLDYRTGEGITADVLGREFAVSMAAARATGDYEAMGRLWREHVSDPDAFREAFREAVATQYEAASLALAGMTTWVTFGNVDRPAMMREYLPEGSVFVDGEVVEIEGLRIGFVGGGVATPMGAQGEVTEDAMREKLAAIGEVDILCSHLPPAIEPLYRDVITGRLERSSGPILDYLREYQPMWHFYGDVHQPQASTWRIGQTRCQNVGYFRATKRPIRLDPVTLEIHR